jgi:hypothetical protein
MYPKTQPCGGWQDFWHDLEKSWLRILEEEFADAGLVLPAIALEELALRVASIIRRRRVVEWTTDPDVQNQMRTGIEDELFTVRAEHRIALELGAIDSILDRCVNSAKKILP